uniref:B30.2/SPRY domain-containing protein n=1 Tax=Meleagris gallopavo TaxID=9103 RepID=A0A803Y9A7_MELGA
MARKIGKDPSCLERVNAVSRVKSAAAGHGCQRWHCLALGRVPLLHAGTSSCDSWAGPSIQGGESRTRFCCFQVKLQKSLEQLSKEVEDMKKRESEAKMKTQECKQELSATQEVLPGFFQTLPTPTPGCCHVFAGLPKQSYPEPGMQEKVKRKRETIVCEFGKLHQLLADEEKLLLQKLEEEETQILVMISENLARVTEQKCLLVELILEIKEKMQQPVEGLLKDMRCILNRCETMKFQAPKPVSVNLKEDYSIPERCMGMRHMLRKFKVDVTLDPETAHHELVLSEDRKSVRRGSRKLFLLLFDSPKRFSCVPVVLGLQAFFSGRSYWEVQVGDKPEWGLGLCKEAACRKGSIVFSPQNGYWVLRLQNGGYEALTCPVSCLTPSVRPRCIGIFLDYEAGEISFYNVSDRSHLYTFTDKFSGKLRPFFYLGSLMGGKNAEPLVISWMRDTQGTSCVVL